MIKSAAGSNGKIDAFGFCWSETNNTPIITDEHLEMEQAVSIGKYFTTTITDLEPNTLYYIRAYAKNTVDGEERYGYGEVYEITTGTLITPKIEIDMEDDGQGNYFNTYEITSSSIHFMATITNYDEEALVEKGLIWSNSDPNITLEKAKERGTVLSLDINEGGRHIDGTIEDLKTDTRYYLYAYAVYGAAGMEKIGYSDQLVFNTKPLNLPQISGSSTYGNDEGIVLSTGLSNYGDGEITEIGYLWKVQSETDNPELNLDNCEGHTSFEVENYSDFTITITGLKPSSTIDFAIYIKSVIDGIEYVTYTCHWTFTTGDPRTPEFNNINWKAATLNSVTVSCGIRKEGDGDIIEKGFVWLKYPDDGNWQEPRLEDNNLGYKAVTDGTNESFSLEITDLLPNTTYCFRAYAKMKYGDNEYISYSNSEVWSTQNYSLPDYIYVNVPDECITFSGAVLKSGIQNIGNCTILKTGFCINHSSKTSQPTVNNNDFILDADDSYSATLSGLKHDTEYAVRFYATCKVGDKEETAYSGTTHFRTKRPAETTFNNVNIDKTLMTSVTISSGIAEYGDGEVIERGVIWKKGYWEWPSFEDKNYEGYQKLTTDEKEFTVDVTGLQVSTEYSFRIYVKTKVEGVEYLSYSDYASTITSALNFDLRIEDITLTSCKLTGIANYDLPEGITEYGFSISTESMSSYEMTDLSKGSDLNINKEFTLTLTDLVMNTNYYVGIYVKIGDKVYHAQAGWVFTTKNMPTIDSNPSPDKKD